MPYFAATFKFPTRFHNPNDKKTGACNFSPTCTDVTGAHHTVIVQASNAARIIRYAADEGMHLTRVEEIFFIKTLPEEFDVSVSAGQSVAPSTDGREEDGGSTRLSAANSDTTFDLLADGGSGLPINLPPGVPLSVVHELTSEVEEDRARRRAPSGD